MFNSLPVILILTVAGYPILSLIRNFNQENLLVILVAVIMSLPAYGKANKRYMDGFRMISFMTVASGFLPSILTFSQAETYVWLLVAVGQVALTVLILGINYATNQRNMHRSWFLAGLGFVAQHFIGRAEERATKRATRRNPRKAVIQPAIAQKKAQPLDARQDMRRRAAASLERNRK